MTSATEQSCRRETRRQRRTKCRRTSLLRALAIEIGAISNVEPPRKKREMTRKVLPNHFLIVAGWLDLRDGAERRRARRSAEMLGDTPFDVVTAPNADIFCAESRSLGVRR